MYYMMQHREATFRLQIAGLNYLTSNVHFMHTNPKTPSKWVSHIHSATTTVKIQVNSQGYQIFVQSIVKW